MRIDPYSDWRMMDYWGRWPNWARVVSALLVIGFAGFWIFAQVWVLAIIVGVIGLMMLAHGIFGRPEDGPTP